MKDKILNVKKALEADKLVEKKKNLKNDLDIRVQEHVSNIATLNSTLAFSERAQQNLKSDYELLGDQMDKF